MIVSKKDSSRNSILALTNIAILRADYSSRYQFISQTGPHSALHSPEVQTVAEFHLGQSGVLFLSEPCCLCRENRKIPTQHKVWFDSLLIIFENNRWKKT